MTDEELRIPSIAPVAPGELRPRWSVMIPTYNSAATIAETLASVLVDPPAGDRMQIAVIDNASTDATLDIVRQLAPESGGRVDVHRHPQNLGLLANWNACLTQSRGELVHILHADDFVRPGFYAAVEAAFAERPHADLCLVRALVVDGRSEPERLAGRLGRTGDELTSASLAYGNEFYCPGVVVRRSAYERMGGFSPALSYVPDWEMWLRILSSGTGVYVNELLVCYREMSGNLTNRFSQTADDLRELVRFGDVLKRRVPGFVPIRWRGFLKQHAVWAMTNWERAGDTTAYKANRRYWRQFATTGEKLDVALARAKVFGKKCERPLRSLSRRIRNKS
jgi:glycosyltransferase involved in cell wall biosynthesis